MYNYYPCPYFDDSFYDDDCRQTPTTPAGPADPYTYPGNFPEALKLIEDAVSGEREDELFYDYLIGVAPTKEAKNIIMGIRDDERKHNKMFRRLYTDLTRKVLPPNTEANFKKPESYCEGIRDALMGELKAVQRYRRILFALNNRVHINMLVEIITDELRHASLYNYLFASGKCMR